MSLGGALGSICRDVCSLLPALQEGGSLHHVQLLSASHLTQLWLGWPVAWLQRRAWIFSLGAAAQFQCSSPGTHAYLFAWKHSGTGPVF